MALRKPATRTSSNAATLLNESYKVVKRPARGYHKFRNGLLNVTPKGSEEALVRSNQQVPLLRLPTEIRKCIWEYALGGKIFLARETQTNCTFTPRETGSFPSVALLRVCRQIYSETAVLPCRLGVFACDSSRRLGRAAKILKPYQRKKVTQLVLVCKQNYAWSWMDDISFKRNGANLRELFPALQHIEVYFHKLHASLHDDQVEKLREHLHDTIRETGCKISVVEKVSCMDYQFMGPD